MRPSVLILIGIFLPGVASAQDRRWEVEGYAAALAWQPTSAGTRALPAAGPPIVTSTPTFPARATPSWLFGDGASLLNGVLDEFGVASRITPLDGMFAPIETHRTATFGMRVRRWLTPRTALEISLGRTAGHAIDTGRLAAAVDTSAAGFEAAFRNLFSTGPFAGVSVVTQQATVKDLYEETAVTAAFNRDIGRHAALQPYVTVGGGAVFPTHAVFSAQIHGRYAASILGDVPIDETDQVSVHATRSTTFAVLAGGGVRWDVSSQWALRFDARWLASPDSTRMTLDAQPSSLRGTPAGFIESFTNPAIQFSNDPSTGRRTSLSGDPIQGFEAFKGGLVARTILSVAISRRF
jgi:opacity protein-like surface antigen